MFCKGFLRIKNKFIVHSLIYITNVTTYTAVMLIVTCLCLPTEWRPILRCWTIKNGFWTELWRRGWQWIWVSSTYAWHDEKSIIKGCFVPITEGDLFKSKSTYKTMSIDLTFFKYTQVCFFIYLQYSVLLSSECYLSSRIVICVLYWEGSFVSF